MGLRNAPVVPRGVKERPWGPFFDQKLSGFRIHNADAGKFSILRPRMQGTGETFSDAKSKTYLHRTIANSMTILFVSLNIGSIRVSSRFFVLIYIYWK